MIESFSHRGHRFQFRKNGQEEVVVSTEPIGRNGMHCYAVVKPYRDKYKAADYILDKIADKEKLAAKRACPVCASASVEDFVDEIGTDPELDEPKTLRCKGCGYCFGPEEMKATMEARA